MEIIDGYPGQCSSQFPFYDSKIILKHRNTFFSIQEKDQYQTQFDKYLFFQSVFRR